MKSDSPELELIASSASDGGLLQGNICNCNINQDCHCYGTIKEKVKVLWILMHGLMKIYHVFLTKKCETIQKMY